MIKVITYGTYDMLHYGHIRLLERAKALGDYLIVGVTSDDFDKTRGKINIQQSLSERVEAVRATGIADEIIVEEYEGQKIDDIRRYDVDIFTVGSDWVGKFDYLNEFCKVVYLERTQGVSSTELRAKQRSIRIGFIGDKESRILNKYYTECGYVNGAEISGICTTDSKLKDSFKSKKVLVTENYQELLSESDAVYIISHPSLHYEHTRIALEAGKHVLIESPTAMTRRQSRELFELANKKKLILMDAIKTAYSTAYNRLLLLVKSGRIGKVVSVDASCTSIRSVDISKGEHKEIWNSIYAWGPTAMLPVFQLLGTEYKDARIASFYAEKEHKFDAFTKIDFLYDEAVASIKVGRGVKTEGELVISGTEGYIYVPAPWWKTDYFEVRYENQENNRRYFYQLDGEGIRYELVAFLKSINSARSNTYVSEEISEEIAGMMEQYYSGKGAEIR